MTEQVWNVTKLNRYIKNLIDTNSFLNGIMVEGEISNLTKHSSGHWYFSLKDLNSRINCVMFRSYANNVRCDVKNGDKVTLKGSVSVYEESGAYQIYVTDIKPTGIGDLYYQLEKLKKEYEAKGYFAIEHKKKIPLYPSKIGIICGENTAAFKDIIRTIYRRWPIVQINTYFTLVQGTEAIAGIVKAINDADKEKNDVILLARGGGSIDDLWCFNSKEVVESIYNANTPIITGIGHEVDFTLADFVSDLRTSTPTAAAEKATPDIKEVKEQLNLSFNSMNRSMINRVDSKYMKLDIIFNRLKSYNNTIIVKKTNIHNLESKLLTSLSSKIQRAKIDIENSKSNFNILVKHIIENKANNVRKYLELLDAYNPTNILKRGYGIIIDNNGESVKTINNVKVNDNVIVKLNDGQLKTKIEEVIKDEK